MAKSKKRSSPELKVVFDTNAIYTEAAAYLFQREVAELIRANSTHNDLRIRWYLPDIVRSEREYQMRGNGVALLPSVQKIERVLGHNLNITEHTIFDGVRTRIDEQLRDLNVETLPVDVTQVKWDRVINDAVYRVPPFDKGEKEKGFRDAVILESFLQLVSSSPKTPRSCRIVLVTDDGLLREAAKARTTGAKNVRVLENIGDLKGLINTLVSKIDEAFVANIQDAATKYFFQKDSKDGLYYREHVSDKISERFAAELKQVPSGFDGKDRETTWIVHPRFSRKEGQRVYWVSRIKIEYKPYRLETPAQIYVRSLPPHDPIEPPPNLGTASAYGGTWPPGPISPSEYLTILSPQSSGGNVAGTTITPKEKVFGKKGQIVFDVTWSVVVTTQRHNFSAPKIESIDFVEAVW